MKLPSSLLSKTIFLHVPPRLLYGFRRKALATDKEILAWLIGEGYREGKKTTIELTDLYYPALAVQTEVEVNAVPQTKPIGWLGTLHSHPQCATHLSPADVNGAVMDGELIFGIFTYYKYQDRKKRATSMDWYAPGKVVVVTK